jgi:hypothetical protein
MNPAFRNSFALCASWFLSLAAIGLRADQLQMQNGDRYIGKVLSVTTDSVVLQSDVLGKITLPRSKVAQLTFGAGAVTNVVQTAIVPSSTLANTNVDVSAALRNLGANTNFIQQIRGQMLDAAGPEANAKYDELIGGLMSGKLNLEDIRKEAKSSADQIKELKRELGPEADDSFDGYLGILESFLSETAPAPSNNSATNAPASEMRSNFSVESKPGRLTR